MDSLLVELFVGLVLFSLCCCVRVMCIHIHMYSYEECFDRGETMQNIRAPRPSVLCACVRSALAI
jgi:hypothetical protein